MAAQPEIRSSACPHDCPSTCALEVERIGERLVGKVRGAKENTYTAGVICSKVARYAERIHHPDRLTTPLRRTAGKGSGFEPVSWDDALDVVAEALLEYETLSGEEVDALLRGESIHRGESEAEAGGGRRASVPLSDTPEAPETPEADSPPPEAPPDLAAAPQPEN